MTVGTIGTTLNEIREDFRYFLENAKEETQTLKQFFKESLDKCSGEFEEQCVKEILIEEYEQYLNNM